MSEPLVIVGNGMAAARLVEELSARALGRYAICVVGDEPRLAYNRVLLSSLLASETGLEEMELKPAGWWRERGVTLVYGRAAAAIDIRARKVLLKGGRHLPYSRLVLATGSSPVRLPLPGADLAGVFTFRTLADAAALMERCRTRKRAIVIGGGLLGLEAAYGLSCAGARVTVVHLMDRLMERQLDARAAGLLKAALEARGIEVLLNARSAAILGRRKVHALRLEDGRVLQTNVVVMAAGVKPNAQLARCAGIAVNHGILVNDFLETSAPGIYALGECAEHRGTAYGLVEPAYEQARVLAIRLAGGTARYEGSPLATNLKVSGVRLFSAGEFEPAQGAEPIIFADTEQQLYRKLVIRDGRLAGAVLYGDTADAPWYLDLIRSGARLGALQESLAFGRAFAPSESKQEP